MGFASLGVLESVVRATIGLRWEEGGELSDILALVDADISQAIQVSPFIKIRHLLGIVWTYIRWQKIQSSKEEVDAGRVADPGDARLVVSALRSAVRDSFVDCEAWGGEFPYERASGSIEFWKM